MMETELKAVARKEKVDYDMLCQRLGDRVEQNKALSRDIFIALKGGSRSVQGEEGRVLKEQEITVASVLSFAHLS